MQNVGKSNIDGLPLRFKHLKTNGFNLEDMSLTDLKKIRLMISLVVVAYILAVREGIIEE
jgi:hypothetical protein